MYIVILEEYAMPAEESSHDFPGERSWKGSGQSIQTRVDLQKTLPSFDRLMKHY